MERNQKAGLWLASGLILCGSTMTSISIPGPWNEPDFTLGVLGLAGLVCLYMAWFRFRLSEHGIVPTIDRWVDAERNWHHPIVFGFFLIACINMMRYYPVPAPEPFSLILLLIAGLSLLHGIYVWSVVAGPLKTSSHSEEE